MSHTYSDMNGHTALSSKAAAMAAAKGMITVISAGNEGAYAWKYITAPADADSILTVGAIDTLKRTASFSSYGPSADGRVKPDVTAVGWNATILTPSNILSAGNGTSFSSPIMAGLTACLWQAFPYKTNVEIMQAIRKSSSLYSTPDNRQGYGVPNFSLAMTILATTPVKEVAQLPIGITSFFNAATGSISFKTMEPLPSPTSISIYTISGNVVFQKNFAQIEAGQSLELTNASNWVAGIYLVSVNSVAYHWQSKLVKY